MSDKQIDFSWLTDAFVKPLRRFQNTTQPRPPPPPLVEATGGPTASLNERHGADLWERERHRSRRAQSSACCRPIAPDGCLEGRGDGPAVGRVQARRGVHLLRSQLVQALQDDLPALCQGHQGARE